MRSGYCLKQFFLSFRYQSSRRTMSSFDPLSLACLFCASSAFVVLGQNVQSVSIVPLKLLLKILYILGQVNHFIEFVGFFHWDVLAVDKLSWQIFTAFSKKSVTSISPSETFLRGYQKQVWFLFES